MLNYTADYLLVEAVVRVFLKHLIKLHVVEFDSLVGESRLALYLPLAKQFVALLGQWYITLVQYSPESWEGDLSTPSSVLVFEKGFDKDPVNSNMIPDLCKNPMQVLLFSLRQKIFRV